MTVSQQSVRIGSQVLGFTVVQYGGRFALGLPNGRGGISIESFRRQRGTSVVAQLAGVGIAATMRPSGRPSTFDIVF